MLSLMQGTFTIGWINRHGFIDLLHDITSTFTNRSEPSGQEQNTYPTYLLKTNADLSKHTRKANKKKSMLKSEIRV